MNNLTAIHSKPDTLAENVNDLGNFIGNTPLYPVRALHKNEDVRIFAKVEWQQFGSSVKARPAYRIIRDAVENGTLDRDRILLDASSGNTGIAYAHMGASLGIPVTLCLPENASIERKNILKALGVDLRFTSRMGGTDEAQQIAKEIHENDPGKYFYADQYSNDSNWKAHFDSTAPEIWNQTGGNITHFITGLGTTGTFTGTGRRLKQYKPGIRLISVQPELAMHGLEGWKHMETAQVPSIYDASLADEHRTISTEEAHDVLKVAANEEGLLLSPSSAANLAAALKLARELEEGTIVTVFPDDGSKYGEIIDNLN
ncbi:MAG TPA: cysteine synthase family protein [Halalkalibaculum sp.]|nr:cysteine synthase family protein [Halalkalibaculum sp.]